jgi:hypothetical protein
MASGTFPCTEHDPVCATCEAEADAAIAICFEEAARVADHYSNYDGGRAAAALRAYGSKQIILPLPQKETSE